MEIKKHNLNEIKAVELISEEVIIKNTEDALDLIGNIYYQGFDRMILHKKNITPDFFELKNKMAGDILQKFSTYRVRLVIVGDFSNLTCKSLKAFICESNRGKQVNFLNSISDALRT